VIYLHIQSRSASRPVIRANAGHPEGRPGRERSGKQPETLMNSCTCKRSAFTTIFTHTLLKCVNGRLLPTCNMSIKRPYTDSVILDVPQPSSATINRRQCYYPIRRRPTLLQIWILDDSQSYLFACARHLAASQHIYCTKLLPTQPSHKTHLLPKILLFRALVTMCMCTQYQSPTCSHQWLSLTESCGDGMNLISCSYRNTIQGLWAPGMCCPWCNGSAQDPFVNQMLPPLATCRPGLSCGIGPSQCGVGPSPCDIAGPPCCASSCCCRRCRRKGRSHYRYRYSEQDGGACTVM
jgi:hypothetical protein